MAPAGISSGIKLLWNIYDILNDVKAYTTHLISNNSFFLIFFFK